MTPNPFVVIEPFKTLPLFDRTRTTVSRSFHPEDIPLVAVFGERLVLADHFIGQLLTSLFQVQGRLRASSTTKDIKHPLDAVEHVELTKIDILYKKGCSLWALS